MTCSCNPEASPASGHAGLVILQSAPTTAPLPRSSDHAALLTEEEKHHRWGTFEGGFTFLPVELFKTDNAYYVFDAKNVMFFKVDRVAFDVLAILRERNASLDELISLLKQHSENEVRLALAELLEAQSKGLLVHYEFRRAPTYENSQYEETLSESMGGFTVFISTQCNLGCSYCIYGGQYDQHEELSQTPMPWTTVQNMMRFLQEHSKKSKQVRLDFFGGEPLLAFDMIRRGVEFLKSIVEPGGPEVLVTITSNGTVIAERIIDFLLAHNVFLQFSIDGSRETHDRHRTFKNNSRGSFEMIFRNLQRIYDRDPEYFRTNIRIKGVITTETLNNDDCEFFEHDLVRIILQGGNFTFLNLEPHYDLGKDDDYFDRIHSLGEKLLRMEGLGSETDVLQRLNVRQAALYRHTFGIFFNAQALNQVYFAGMDSIPFMKACLTGYQEGAVSPNGDISICLKSAKGANFVIGNVNEGRWYYEKMRNLNTVLHRDWAGCASCFVQKMCDLCYEKMDGEEGQFVAARSKFCHFNRARHRLIFQYMLRVMENNPKLWQYLEEVITDQISQQSEPSSPEQSKSLEGHFGSRNLLMGQAID
jgi:uncharacterized protein